MTTAVLGMDLAGTLRQRFPDVVIYADDTAVWVTPESICDVCAYLKADPDHQYDLLNLLSAVDYVEYFEVVYHMTSIERNVSTVVKTRCYGRDSPTVASVSGVWRGAQLHEREAYDLMGVNFAGHPDLRRILLWEGFEGHPLRRDYLEPPLPYKWPHGG